MTSAKLLGMLVLGTVLWGADPALGTWKLNPAKSAYVPGPKPKTATIGYEETADGIKRAGQSVDGEGNSSSFTYVAKYDGQD